MPDCPECGTNPERDAHTLEIFNARLLHYRRALFMACGGDHEKVKEFMRETEPD